MSLPDIDVPKVEAVQERLGSMIGMGGVHRQVNSLIADAIKARHRLEAGMPVPDKTMHLVFSGPPGTGKTTVAKELGQLYHALGLTPRDSFTEVDRSDLVAEYSGQTAVKTRAAFNKARGGVLFIDEAYALKSGTHDEFGQEAIDELVKLMEEHRDDTVVILAGYGPEMNKMISANPGMASRLPRTINFKPYSSSDMVKISGKMLGERSFAAKPAAQRAMKEAVRSMLPEGNAREVRNLVDAVDSAQSRRLMAEHGGAKPPVSALRELTEADVAEGVADYQDTRPARSKA